MDDPVATCLRIAEIEHDGILARGSDKAPIGGWRNIPIRLVTTVAQERCLHEAKKSRPNIGRLI
jgi:hypothetical protein